MQETEHYKLTKDAPEDFYDVSKVNANTDKVDAALYGLETGKAPREHGHTATEVGARPNTWMPTAPETGAIPASQKGTANGVATLGADGLLPVSQMPKEAKEVRIVATIAERNALTGKFAGLSVYVKDASADPTVSKGGAYYLWDGSVWIKTGEAESMDVVTKWPDIQEKPVTFPPSGHTHAQAEIAGLSAALAAKAAIFGPVTVSVPVASWAGAGPWTQTVAVAGVLDSDNGLGVYPVDIADKTARDAYKKAYACLSVEADTVAGGILLTCRDAKPEITFNIVVKGVR